MLCESLTDCKDLATILGVFIALGTLVKALIEFAHQGAQKRSEFFLAMRKRLKENTVFEELCALIDVDDQALEKVPFKDRRSFLGFFEEVALMMNSGLIRPEVAHYMFGYYAIRCWESEHFWSDVNRDSYYWILFKDFVAQMKRHESNFHFRRRAYKF